MKTRRREAIARLSTLLAGLLLVACASDSAMSADDVYSIEVELSAAKPAPTKAPNPVNAVPIPSLVERGQSVTVHSRAQGLLGRNIYPVHADRSGNVWLGAWPTGLSRITNGRVGLPPLMLSAKNETT